MTANELLNLLLKAKNDGINLDDLIWLTDTREKYNISLPVLAAEIDPTENSVILYYNGKNFNN